jgi:hypothetical protein
MDLTSARQIIFDKVARHLLTQNKKSTKGRNCTYRSVDEKGNVLMCAAGCLIPDRLYNEKEIEGWTWYHLALGIRISSYRSILGDDMPDDLKFIHGLDTFVACYLQTIHDSVPPMDWKNKLREVAINTHLNDKVLDEVTK